MGSARAGALALCVLLRSQDAPHPFGPPGSDCRAADSRGGPILTLPRTVGTRYKYGGEHPERMGLSDAGAVAEADERNAVFELVSSVLIAIRSSFLAFVVTVGVVLVLLSLVLSEHVLPGFSYGMVAAMLFVWGISAFVYAVAGHIGLKLIGYH